MLSKDQICWPRIKTTRDSRPVRSPCQAADKNLGAEMTLVLKGVMQSPVTPLEEDFSPEYATFERLVDFHVRTGATAISWPQHKAESLNLTLVERKPLSGVAIKAVAKRVPISIHVSALSVEDTFDLARHAQ